MGTGAGIGAAANIIGGELQGWAALLDKWAMADAYQRQAALQQQYARQGAQALSDRLVTAGAGPAQQEMAQGAGQRQANYASVNATPLSVAPTPLSQGQNARNNAYVGLLGAQRARLGSYGDWLQQQWVQNQQTNRQLGQIGNFAAGSASVFPLQMYAAQHSMDDLAAVGQAISSIGGSAPAYQNLFASTPKTSTSTGGSNDYGNEMNLGFGAGNQADYAGELGI